MARRACSGAVATSSSGSSTPSAKSIFAEQRPVNPLSPRELEILCLIALGGHNGEIATELGLRVQTVKNHVTTTLHQHGLRNRTRAVTYAVLGLASARQALSPNGPIPRVG